MPIVPFLAKGFADVLSIGLSMSNDFLSYCESLPFTQLIFGKTPFNLVAVYCASIVSILTESAEKYSLYSCECISFISTCHYIYPYFRGSGSVTFIDVGQGDAILIRLPYDKGFILLIQVERFV